MAHSSNSYRSKTYTCKGRGLRPLHPRFPTLVGLGFASVLSLSEAKSSLKFSPFPRREGGQGVRSERHTPHAPLPTL